MQVLVEDDDDDEDVPSQGEPWLDPTTGTFYLAHIEITEHAYEYMPQQQQQQQHDAQHLSTEVLPSLVQEWIQWAQRSGVIANRQELRERMRGFMENKNSHKNNKNNNLGDILSEKNSKSHTRGDDDNTHYHKHKDNNLTERALWVAALLNPTQPYRKPACLDIRPAMLACTNDYDRTVLAVQALQSSIDHMMAGTT